ncbi:MAG: tail fiber protein [Candidatus Acidiferrales bacterium]
MRRSLLLLIAVAFLICSPAAHAQATDAFLGQILMVSFQFAPKGWALCNGQILPITQNTALFSLLGTTFGGDGVRTFALPDLRGRVPIHQGTDSATGTPFTLGQTGGEEQVTLLVSQIPAHTHSLSAESAVGTSNNPSGNIWGAQSRLNVYSSSSADIAMSFSSVSFAGGSQPHDNHSPYLTINYIIALVGVFPSRD